MMDEYKIMEEEVCSLLQKHASSTHAKEILAPKIAQTSLMMNHLYEDLGFESRTQMGKFMKENFLTLAEIKPKDTLWKKFMYDSIGKVAPACAGCSDAVNCFKCLLEEASA
jgi:nitrogen fixation protein NifQ